jgi:hypothetical protein
MATEKTREQIVNDHNRPSMVGDLNGNLDYPSSRGLGVDTVQYWKRNPHPQEHTPLPVQTQVRHIPALIVSDLEDAANHGELRTELQRHIDLLEQNRLADEGTIDMLRFHQRELVGHPACDRDQLDTIKAVVLSCGPKGV